jgi:hypothetical protein
LECGASQISPSLQSLALQHLPTPFPPPPPKIKKVWAPLLSLSSSLLGEERHKRGWTKCLKGKRCQKYFFKVKTSRIKKPPFRQDVLKPWQYLAKKLEDLKAWITACKNYSQWHAWQWVIDTNKIKYSIVQFKTPSRAQDFGTQYHRETDRTDSFIVHPVHQYWATKILAIQN